MNVNKSKVIIRTVQDFCFANDSSIFVDKFASWISESVIRLQLNNRLNATAFQKEASKRKDFFSANSIESDDFCLRLFQTIVHELDFIRTEPVYSTLLRFKELMERGTFRDFPRDKTNEAMLRGALNIFLNSETFCEARTGGGNSDIIIPDKKTIIETKLWNGAEYYNSGFPELNAYLESYKYKNGFYVIFDYNKGDNEIIKTSSEAFKKVYDNNEIEVFFIRMNKESPSKIYKKSKKTT